MFSRVTTVTILRGVATVLVMSWLIGLVVTLYVMTTAVCGLDASRNAASVVKAGAIASALCVTSITLLFFPIGVVLHWLIARRTGGLTLRSRQALFWSSVFVCLLFPVGTIMGGVTLWLLFSVDVFGGKR